MNKRRMLMLGIAIVLVAAAGVVAYRSYQGQPQAMPLAELAREMMDARSAGDSEKADEPGAVV